MIHWSWVCRRASVRSDDRRRSGAAGWRAVGTVAVEVGGRVAWGARAVWVVATGVAMAEAVEAAVVTAAAATRVVVAKAAAAAGVAVVAAAVVTEMADGKE